MLTYNAKLLRFPPRSKSTTSVLDVKNLWLLQGEDTNTWEKKKQNKTFINNPTVKWKITLWAWQINCWIKVLMGNKESKNSYSSFKNKIKLMRFSMWPPRELLFSGLLVAAPQIMLPYLKLMKAGTPRPFPKDGGEPCFNSVSKCRETFYECLTAKNVSLRSSGMKSL